LSRVAHCGNDKFARHFLKGLVSLLSPVLVHPITSYFALYKDDVIIIIIIIIIIFYLFLDRIARSTYVDAVHCYRPSSVVYRSISRLICRSVTVVSPAKTAEPI